MTVSSFAGLRGSLDFAADERPRTFREYIAKVGWAGQAPIFALSQRAQKEQAADPQFYWWAEAETLVQLQTSGALASGDTTVTVSSADPDSTTLGTITAKGAVYTNALTLAGRWGAAVNLVPGDQLVVEPSADAAWAPASIEVVEVDTVLSSTQFTILRGRQGTTAGSIASGSVLTKIGSAFAEGTGAPKSTSRNPIKYGNNLQIFKTTYEVAQTTANIQNLRTGNVLVNERARRAFDHAKDIETALIFGFPSEVLDPTTGKPKRTTGGLRYFIHTYAAQNEHIFTSAVSTKDLIDYMSRVFEISTPGGEERICFVGNGAMNEINKIVAQGSSGSNGMFYWGDSVKAFGMELKKLNFPQGTFYLKTHPMMSQHAYMRYGMLIVDFSALRWRFSAGRNSKFTDNVQTKDEDVFRGLWLTEGGLELSYGALTCGYIGGISQT